MPSLIQKKEARVVGATFVFALLWVLLWATKFQWSSNSEVYWTFILYGLCCLPTLTFVGGHHLRIPIMPMWGLGYFMLFGMPMFSEAEQQSLGFTSPEAVISAMKLTVAGASFCLLTFYSPIGKWAEVILPRVRAPWNLQRAPRAGVILCLIGILINYYRLTSPPSAAWNQILYLLSQLAILGILTLFLLQLRGKLSWVLKFFLWGFVIPLEFLSGLGTGAVYNALIVIAPIFLCYAAERRKIPILWGLLTLAVCFAPFSGFKGEYRSYAWYGEEGPIVITASPVQRGFAFIQLVTLRLTEGGIEAYSVAAETASERVSHLDVLINVMEATPAFVPYWKGETYRTLFWLLVPRVLFPDKPLKGLGQRFGHRYGFLGEEDVSTSYNLPHQVIEMYINFGVMGVWIGMALLGCLYRAVASFLGHPEAGERGLIIGCGISTILLTLDGAFTLIFGGVVYYLLLLRFVYRRFLGPAEAPTALPTEEKKVG